MDLKRPSVAGLAVLVSLLLSAWAVATQELINDDGVLYLLAAGYLLDGDRAAALATYPWPFYSALIAAVAWLTGLALDGAAQVVNAVSHALIAFAFVRLLEALGADRKTHWIGALCLLAWPYLNEQRAEVIRDNGYWAFYTLSLWLYARHADEPSGRRALAGSAALLTALLLRLDGLAALALLPLAPFAATQRPLAVRIKAALMGYALPVLILAFAALAIGADWIPAGRTAELPNWIAALRTGFTGHLARAADALGQAVLGPWSRDEAGLALAGAFTALALGKLVATLTPVYLAPLLMRGRRASGRFTAGGSAVLFAGALAHAAVIAAFLAKHQFLTGRYVVALALTLLPFVARSMAALFDAVRERAGRTAGRFLLAGFVTLGLAWNLGDSLHSTSRGYGAYLRDAGAWLATHAPAPSTLVTNHARLDWYAGRRRIGMRQEDWTETRKLLQANTWRTADWLAIRLGGKEKAAEKELLALVGAEPVTTFRNEKGDVVLVWRLR